MNHAQAGQKRWRLKVGMCKQCRIGFLFFFFIRKDSILKITSKDGAAAFFGRADNLLFSARSCALVVVNAYSKRGKRATISGFCKISGSADFEKL